jgi:hypothetical protein
MVVVPFFFLILFQVKGTITSTLLQECIRLNDLFILFDEFKIVFNTYAPLFWEHNDWRNLPVLVTWENNFKRLQIYKINGFMKINHFA